MIQLLSLTLTILPRRSSISSLIARMVAKRSYMVHYAGTKAVIRPFALRQDVHTVCSRGMLPLLLLRQKCEKQPCFELVCRPGIPMKGTGNIIFKNYDSIFKNYDSVKRNCHELMRTVQCTCVCKAES